MAFSWFLNLIIFIFFSRASGPALVNTDLTLITRQTDRTAPTMTAERSAVLAADNRSFLWSSHGQETQPIASITKLMTALVFLENNPGWETIYQITDADHVTGGRLNLFLGDRVSVKNLFYTSLVASDNGATMALVHATGLSENEFVKKMNEEARFLGLSETHFDDPVGLSDNNVSSAQEVALLAKAALNRPEIREATECSSYQFQTENGKEIAVTSTDYLLSASTTSAWQILGGKTGYTDKAGYCFVGRFRNPDGREVISAVLDAAGKDERFTESRDLVDWVFAAYQWR